MSRLFVVFRTFDRIWECKTYTRELSPMVMDTSNGPIKLLFMVDHIIMRPDRTEMYSLNYNDLRRKSISRCETNQYCEPHINFYPQIMHLAPKHVPVAMTPTYSTDVGLMRRFSLPHQEMIKIDEGLMETKQDKIFPDVIFFVLPTMRCTILMDAHAASCIASEYSRSRVFRHRFWKYLQKNRGFRDCISDYEQWTESEREAWDNYLTVPYMIDVVTVWPKQKIDYVWSRLVLGLLNKHVVLEESFAWLSTLGGAHSSMGEQFLKHAKKAGEISAQQLKLAKELGNESLIARCHVFWAWSLLQRSQMAKCKTCILNIWKSCRCLAARDTILENMCKAVWSRYRYKRSLMKSRQSFDPCSSVKPPQWKGSESEDSDDDKNCRSKKTSRTDVNKNCTGGGNSFHGHTTSSSLVTNTVMAF